MQDRFTVAAVISYRSHERTIILGSAPSRRRARRIGYRKGVQHHPSRYSAAMFRLEVIDTATGERVRADWADHEVYLRYHQQPTVADVGYW